MSITPRRRTDRRFTEDERFTARERAAELYRAGHTIREVAAAIGRPYSTTRDLLTEADVVLRPSGTRSTANADAP
ncbi:helix-turn-helix domain-containing protein [Streptomyces sp. NPDC002547]